MEAGSPLERAGFRVGDRILRVNGSPIREAESWSDAYASLKGKVETNLEVLRDAGVIRAGLVFKERPRESFEALDVFYEEVTSTYGIRHRTIITRPKKPGKQPAIMILGGLSCSSIEVYPGRTDNWGKTLSGLVEKSGMVVMRVEKAGVGDSEGRCSESDFFTDLAGYEAAIKSLKAKPYVDPERIVVYGSSMGSALAPYFANRHNFAGIISDGTFFKSWFEHMLEIERRIRQFEGDTESEIGKKMNAFYIPLYYGMLVEKKTYREVVSQYPALAAYNYHGDAHMYGRHVSYYHQLQDFDLAGEWEKVQVPVRILRGTNDWIMTADDNEMIVEVLQRNGHQDHVLYEYPGLDHWNTIHEKAKDSYEGKAGVWDDEMVHLLVRWAGELAKKELRAD
jgi:pimeloyl-ACP methyl ester carboxylesterase